VGIGIAVAMVGGGIGIYLYLKFKFDGPLVMKLVTTMQYLATINGIQLKWTPPAKAAIQVFSTFNFNMQVLTPECYLDQSFAARWIWSQCLPWVLIGSLFLLHLVSWMWRKGSSPQSGLVIGSRVTVQQGSHFLPFHTFVSLSLKVLMLFYLSLVTNSFDVFDCVGSGSDKRMASEPSIRCSESDADYLSLRALSYISFVVYVAGIPLLILGGMFWSRRKLTVIHEAAITSVVTSGGFGNAFDGSSVLKDIAKEILLMTSKHFKPQYYFWTAILMARNLLVIVLIRTVPSDRKCSLC
jgi:hypothetical protein